ncbi:endolytic transglycosylase MltG [Frateuria aurantia]
MSKIFRRRLAGLLVLVVVAAVAVSWLGWRSYQRFLATPLAVVKGYDRFDLIRGHGLNDLVAEWRQHGVTTYGPLYWRFAARQLQVQGRLHAGEYALDPGMRPAQLLERMGKGRVMQHPFTLVDGWNMLQVRKALASAPELTHQLPQLDDAALMKALGQSGVAPEGQFLSDTYAYVKGDSDVSVLQRALQAQQHLLAADWAARAPGLPLETPYQALILASIVEKETAQPDERPRIAGVFIRRLQLHMLLETDPTVIYGMGERYAGVIHKADLQMDTPFNTYIHPGLPPTPIAMIGRPALQAALHPADGDELYFVARGDGHHVFARTLQEHNRNVACYQLKHCHD